MIIKQLRTTIAALAVLTGAATATAAAPQWLESDSAAAIQARNARDFPMTISQARDAINERYGLKLTDDSVREYGRRHYLEIKEIDGQERVFRKSVGNLALLHPAMNGNTPPRGSKASPKRIAYVDTILAAYDKGEYPGVGHRIRYRFSIDVPYDKANDGDVLRVWMPVPRESARQRNIRITDAYPANYKLSADLAPSDANVHNSIYFQAPVVEGQPNHFEYTAEFDTYGQYFSPDSILAKLRPYNKNSELYRRNTAFEAPHIVNLSKLARRIVGKEKNPFRQSELVYDYIISRYPWAGAREYSTIPCIPEYVLEEKHGDCGQVSLLYISLMRSLGVPARWESGWMLHPGETNLHDWAEVYFEGVGWVPVDVSFGRYTGASDPRARKFYSTGMDAWRLAANKGVGSPFYPAKQFVRSETVDAQMGEVETSRGNLFYPAWSQNFTIISETPLTGGIPAADGAPVAKPFHKATQKEVDGIVEDMRRRLVPDKRQGIYDVKAVVGANGKAAITGTFSEQAHHDALFNALADNGIEASDLTRVLPDNLWALPRISVAHGRVTPAHSAEMGTQVLMGMPLRLLERKGEYWRVQSPDGYLSWVSESSLTRKTPQQMEAWRKAPRLAVTALQQIQAYDSPTATSPRNVVTDLVPGDIVEGTLDAADNGRVKVTLPDGRTAWAPAADLMPLDKWAAQDFNADRILDEAYSMMGSPYFWGGTSVKNLDCSGLSKVSYLANGIILRRDASQQALTGTRLSARDWRNYKPGDLLFFGNKKTGKVTHVAIYDRDGYYVHSSGLVRRNSVDPFSPDYLRDDFLHAVRIHGNEGTDGITYVRDHPWYF